MTRAGWLEGKAALVVGGGSGIGRGAVEAFREEGARVAVLELDAARCEELRAQAPDAVVVPGDATSLADNRRAVAEAVRAFGRLDVLATFVGVFDWYTPLAEIPDAALDAACAEIFDTNVKSALAAIKACVDELRRSRGTALLTLSTSSFEAGRGGALYVASKFAVRGLVAQLAHELAPEVRVNGVAPGGTLGTELRGLSALGQAGRRLGGGGERERSLRDRSPLQVALTPADHAGAYVYLASDRARGVTGAVLRSDGGWSVR